RKTGGPWAPRDRFLDFGRDLTGGGSLLLPAPGRPRSRFTLALLLGLGRLLRLCVRLALLLHDLGPVDELEDDQGRAIAGAGARVHDARIAAVSVTEARGDGVEELLHHHGVGDHAQDLTARVEGVALG